jgi:hypothetical protein
MASLCCGVAHPKDAEFGLSEAQQDAGARPQLWGTREGASPSPEGRTAGVHADLIRID